MEIQLQGLTKIYGSENNQFFALNDINLTIMHGEFISIIGPSGSGKSTLLSIMSGLDSPSSGKVLMDEKNLLSMADNELSKFRRNHFGFIFQQFNLLPTLSVKENIELPLLFDGKKPDLNRLNQLCEELGITDRLNYLPSKLSGGQQQRVAIARALISDPDIIFADEPTGNLDQATSGKVMELLKSMAISRNKTLIVVTHNMNIANMSQRQISIVDGEVSKDTSDIP